MTGATKTVRKDMNRAIIARLIRSAGRISRTEIAAELGITKSTVTSIVSQLIEDGAILEFETGEAASSGGRKPIYLGMNPSFGCVLGLDVRVDSIRCVLLDADGGLLKTRVTESTADADRVLDLCGKAVISFSDEISEMGIPLMGVGVGFPGYADPFKGRILESVAFDIENLDFGGPLSIKLGVPVVVDNDANCCAWGELVAHGAEGPDDFLFVLPKLNRYCSAPGTHRSLGIGIGVVIDNTVRYGNTFATGEIYSPKWRSGSSEQLVALGGGVDISQDADLFRDAVVELMEGLSVVSSVLNPGRIYLGGYFGERYREVVNLVESDLKDSFLGIAAREGLFSQADFDDDDVARGAALMYLERLYGLPDYRNGRGFRQLDWRNIVELTSRE